MDTLPKQEHTHKRFSDKLSFLLNNPIRRKFSPPERLIAKLGIEPGSTVLDFGCGPGFFLIPTARIAGKAIGADVSSRMLEQAASYAKKSRVVVELLESDGKSVKLADGSVDLIMLVHVFHEIGDKPIVLREFYRILKPGGRLAIVEKTQAGGLPRRFGPPVVDLTRLTKQVAEAGFAQEETKPSGKDSIAFYRK